MSAFLVKIDTDNTVTVTYYKDIEDARSDAYSYTQSRGMGNDPVDQMEVNGLEFFRLRTHPKDMMPSAIVGEGTDIRFLVVKHLGPDGFPVVVRIYKEHSPAQKFLESGMAVLKLLSKKKDAYAMYQTEFGLAVIIQI